MRYIWEKRDIREIVNVIVAIRESKGIRIIVSTVKIFDNLEQNGIFCGMILACSQPIPIYQITHLSLFRS